MSDKEEKNNAVGSNGSGSDRDGGTVEPRVSGAQGDPASVPGDTGRGTESESRGSGESDRDPDSKGQSTGDPGRGSGSDTKMEPGGDRGDRVESVQSDEPNRDESPADRKRRLDRERKRELRRRNTGSTGTSGAAGTGGSSGDQKSPTVVPLRQKEPKNVKPKPTSTQVKSGKKKNDDIDEGELTAFIIGIFNLFGGIMGSHWYISKDEAEQISEPLTRILNKQNKKLKSKTNDMMAPMLLITAIGSIVVPRMAIQVMEWKEKKNERRIRERNVSGLRPRTDSGQADRGRGELEREAAGDHEEREVQQNEYARKNDVEHVPTVPSFLVGAFNE